ncbi:Hypothetical predicted protein [Marmota monax]|uniref:Uncharacterized protein n=1 Tax=Marmota monax TaxID=9995 RepID=A0A5E4C8W3_MARMO|nr:Hypothetical predicted protein [Marmota monax]
MMGEGLNEDISAPQQQWEKRTLVSVHGDSSKTQVAGKLMLQSKTPTCSSHQEQSALYGTDVDA